MHQFASFLYLSLCYFAFWQSLINEYDDDDDDNVMCTVQYVEKM